MDYDKCGGVRSGYSSGHTQASTNIDHGMTRLTIDWYQHIPRPSVRVHPPPGSYMTPRLGIVIAIVVSPRVHSRQHSLLRSYYNNITIMPIMLSFSPSLATKSLIETTHQCSKCNIQQQRSQKAAMRKHIRSFQ